MSQFHSGLVICFYDSRLTHFSRTCFAIHPLPFLLTSFMSLSPFKNIVVKHESFTFTTVGITICAYVQKIQVFLLKK